MPTITATDVLTAFASCAGEPEAVLAGCSLEESTFVALGYDSLALIAAVDEIQDRFGVQIPDEAFVDLLTIGQLTALVNGSVGAVR
jgi:act minimal PKS acyl carrier protein